MSKNIRSLYIFILDILHACILFFTYFGGMYAFITWNFVLQSIHFLHIAVVAGMILYFKACLLTDYTNIQVEKNGGSRKNFSDFTQYIFFVFFRKKISPKILGKINEFSVILWALLFIIAVYQKLF